MLTRNLQTIVSGKLFKGKAIIISGARQVGKTTILKNLLKSNAKFTLWLNADEADVRELLNNAGIARIKQIIGKHKILVIDEAQRIDSIGLFLKIFVDNFKDKQVIATGSSSLDLASSINEPLTGRKFEYMLYPFSFKELVDEFGLIEEKRNLEIRLLYGCYPDIVLNPTDAEELLKNLAGSYLYKDLLMLEGIKKPALLDKLLQALALQIGNEVSYLELAQLLKVDNQTIEKYIDLLEKAFVVFKLPAYSNNLRNEIKKSKKIYFYDTGIRNAVINNFAPLSMRTDSGALFENYIIAERKKYNDANGFTPRYYFWRTHQQQEIDLIEDINVKLNAIEIKWRKAIARFPKSFTDSYKKSTTKLVTKANVEDILL